MDRPVIKSTDLITICGARGSGKTTWEKKISKGFAGTEFLAFDPLDEYRDIWPQYIPKTNKPEELAEVARYVFYKGNMILLVSEAELYLPNGSLPPDTLKLITQGRHRNTAVWADTRRIANLSKTMFSLSEHVICFRQFSKNDIRYLEDFIPGAAAVRDLPNYHFLYYHRGNSKIFTPLF